MKIRLVLAIGVAAVLTAAGGAVGLAIGVGLGLVILTAREPTPAEQRNAVRGVVVVGLLRRFWR